MYYRYKSRTKWQKPFISQAFSETSGEYIKFNNKLLSNIELLNSKSQYIPNSLFKFYSITANNILDIKNKKLWLSDPNSFNDPYDCQVGYNSIEYEKNKFLEIVKSNGLINEGEDAISEEEFQRINCSLVNGEDEYLFRNKEEYESLMFRILNKKSDEFQRKIRNITSTIQDELNKKINKVRFANIRVACFACIEEYSGICDKLEMWAHYADNHKGFCVEYDMSTLRKDLYLQRKKWDMYGENSDEYMNERLIATIKGGLFPVIYTSARVRIPYTRLQKIGDNSEKLIDEILYKTFITKYTKWNYEKEWRLIVDSSIGEYYNNKIPFPFIKRIYLGCKMEKSNIDILFDIANELGIQIKLMKMQSNKFSLEYISLDSYNINKNRFLLNSPYDI